MIDGTRLRHVVVPGAVVSLVVLGLVVVLFVWNRLPVEVVAIGSALLLYAAGVIGLDDAVAGFGDPTVILIASLFVVSEGLDATGVTTWVGQQLMSKAGGSRRRLLVLVMLLVAIVTALINLNGSVAALLPMLLVVATRRGIPPSKLLMPLAFAGSAGSLLLLTGSPVNVIVSNAAAEAGVGRFGFAEFAIVGVPLVVGTVLVVVLLGDRLLPDRVGASVTSDLGGLARTLTKQYQLGNVAYLAVPAGSPLVGHPRGAWDLRDYPGVSVVTVTDVDADAPASDGALAPGDRLTVVGEPDGVTRFGADHGLELQALRGRDEVEQSLIGRGGGVAEVVIPPRSTLVGEVVAPGRVVPGVIVGAVRTAGPLLLLVALFLLTVVFGQLISNTATALIVIPIAVSAATQLDVSARPVLMCVCIASAASFLTPVATPANMMVMGPAGYRFGDYWKLGLPMVGVFFVVAIELVPLVWSF